MSDNLIKANNYDVACRQVGGEFPEAVGKIPTEINEREKGYFHVVWVESVHRPEKKSYDRRVHKKLFDPKTYMLNKEQFVQLGYGDMFIYHDPTKKESSLNEEGNQSEGGLPEYKKLISDIKECKSIAEVEALIVKGENRKSVLQAAKEKIESFN